MFTYRSRFLTRIEVWFDEQPRAARVDWIYHRQRSQPLARCRSRAFYTRLVNLQKTPDQLFAELDARTARRITEAEEKDRLRFERYDARDPRLLDEFEAMWNRFALAQKDPPFERNWVDQFAQAGALDLTAARDASGTVLNYHLVFLTPKRARQLFAIAPYKPVPDIAWRNAVSRANTWIHWHNFLTFRERGIRHFDFGGWYPGDTDVRLLGMNAFKKGFGGTVVREYECEQPVTLKGRVLLHLAHMLSGLRHARRLDRTDSACTANGTERKAEGISPAFR